MLVGSSLWGGDVSNFHCEHCGTAIIDSPTGYVAGCEHYPLGGPERMPESVLETLERYLPSYREMKGALGPAHTCENCADYRQDTGKCDTCVRHPENEDNWQPREP